MSPVQSKFIYDQDCDVLGWFEGNQKLRVLAGAPGNAFGYKLAREAFRIAGKVPCKYIPDEGKIIGKMIEHFPMKNMLELLKQTSWHYLCVKYGRRLVEIALTGNPRSLGRIRRSRVVAEWSEDGNQQCVSKYDHCGKMDLDTFYGMLLADVVARIRGTERHILAFRQSEKWSSTMRLLYTQLEWKTEPEAAAPGPIHSAAPLWGPGAGAALWIGAGAATV